MNYINLAKKGLLLSLVAIAFSACEKVNEITPIGDGGQTLVRILGAGNIDANFKPAGSLDGRRVDSLFTGSGVLINAIDFVNKPTDLPNTVIIRRDVANKADLNKTMTVVIKDDTLAINRHNLINKTNLVKIPESWYTVQSPSAKVGGQGGSYTLVFKPGEFSKEITINVTNPTILNPSVSYAVAFTITAVDAGGVISYSHTLLMQIGAKNSYDGIYEVTGTFVDLSNPAFTSTYPVRYALVTSGANTVDVININLNGGIPGYSFSNGGAGTFYGSYGLVLTFNPATNAISSLHNYYGDPSKSGTTGGNPANGTGAPVYASANNRRAVLDPSGVNAVQPNKDIIIKHWMVQPQVVAVGPRSTFNEFWKYIGPR